MAQTADAAGKEISKYVEGMVSRLFEKILLTIEREAAQVIDDSGKNTSGDLRKSLGHDIQKKKDELVGRVFTGMFYSIFVHEGTKPHWMPIEPLIRWVHLKGITGRYTIKHPHKRVGRKKTIADEDLAMAKIIQRKIAKKGTAAFKFFDIALANATPRIEAMVKESKNW